MKQRKTAKSQVSQLHKTRGWLQRMEVRERSPHEPFYLLLVFTVRMHPTLGKLARTFGHTKRVVIMDCKEENDVLTIGFLVGLVF